MISGNHDSNDFEEYLAIVGEHMQQMSSFWDRRQLKHCFDEAIRLCEFVIDKIKYLPNDLEDKKLLKHFATTLVDKTEKCKLLLKSEISESSSPECSKFFVKKSDAFITKDKIQFSCGLVSFKDIKGLTEDIEFLKEKVVLPLRFPQLFKNRFLMNIMMYGHPGVGKTLLLRAVAAEAKAQLFVFSPYFLGCHLDNGSSKNLKKVFKIALENRPCILCIEDLEIMENTRNRDLITDLSHHVQELNSSVLDGEKIVLIATSISPWKMSGRLRRLFPLRRHVGLLTIQGRLELLKHYVNNNEFTHDITDETFHTIAELTEGFSGSDLVCLVREALMKTLHQITKSQYFRKVVVYKQDNGKFVLARVLSSSKDNEHTDSSFQSDQYEEKFVYCSEKDPGAMKLNWTDLDQDHLWIDPELSQNILMEVIQAAHPSICLESIEKMQDFDNQYSYK